MRPPFPTPYAGAYYPIYGGKPNEYMPPTDTTPFNKVSALLVAFAHAYPIDPNNWKAGAVLSFQKDQPDQEGRLNKIMCYARHANPNIKFIISLGWGMNDWSFINSDYTGGRNNFPHSVLSFVRQYQFDGFDIDDESIGNDPRSCPPNFYPSGCITQESFNGVIRNLRELFDAAGRADGKPYYLTITPAFGTAQVTKDNIADFDLINPQTYSPGTYPQQFIDLGASPKQVSWGIDTEESSVNYPSRSDYQDLAGIFDWSMSADSYNHAFQYTNKIARDVGYVPEG